MRRVLSSLWLVGVAGCAFNPGGPVTGDDVPEDPDAAVLDGAGDDAADIDAPNLPDIDARPMIDAREIDARPPIDAPMIDAPMIDAPTPVVVDIIHVRAGDETIGTGNLDLNSTLTINTSNTPSATPGLPNGVSLAVVQQDGGGDLVVLRVRDLHIMPPGVLRAVGSRPLVILANNVTLNGWIDAGADRSTPGAGGSTAGTGVGGNGVHLRRYNDSGGGGGSFGGLGADGGDSPCEADCMPNETVQGGTRGTTYGTANLTVLEGGSAGGRTHFGGGANCTAGSPGAGGGAVQVYAATAITIGNNGGINAGGGGGDGGDQCNDPFNFLAGLGGGAGGAIYLQAPTLQNSGLLVANGGGGGGGGGNNGDGQDGGNAGRNNNPGTGAGTSGMYSAAGGNGATQTMPPQSGRDTIDWGNGGGGGGGLGRIHVRLQTIANLGTSSPTATTSTY